jgi:hypothetical protein
MNVQWTDLVLLTFISQSLYHIDKILRWFWIKFEAVSGFEWRARSALSSAKSPVVVWTVIYWSEMNRLNSSGAATTPSGMLAQIGNILDMADPERTEK